MSDREELAGVIARAVDDMTEQDFANASVDYRAEMFAGADAVWAAGWRKMPSREAVIEAMLGPDPENVQDKDKPDYLEIRRVLWEWHEKSADRILALMGGVSEQTEQTEGSGQ